MTSKVKFVVVSGYKIDYSERLVVKYKMNAKDYLCPGYLVCSVGHNRMIIYTRNI